jgi:nitrogen-specific signal transduction histidine kinase
MPIDTTESSEVQSWEVAMHNEWRPAEEKPPVDLTSPGTKRKKLRLVGKQPNEKSSKEEVLDGVLHELQNCLQSIGMGVDLLQLSQPDALECRTINLGIERASRLLREVQEYFFPPEIYLSTKNIGNVLVETVHGITRDAKEINIRLDLPEVLPSFSYDWLVFCRVLERLLCSACGLLSSHGGNIIISATEQAKQTQSYWEIQVTIHGSEPLEIEGKRVFTPFWRVNDYQESLGLVLARQAMEHRHGRLIFEKTNPYRAQFTLLLAVLPEDAGSERVRREAGHGCME